MDAPCLDRIEVELRDDSGGLDAWSGPLCARTMSSFDYSLDFPEWWERDIEAMVTKGRNHPSVVFYSIGNEVSETGSAPGELVAVGHTGGVDRSRETLGTAGADLARRQAL